LPRPGAAIARSASNDRHMLEAARYFHITGVNVLADNG
jgi:hypothetical protein